MKNPAPVITVSGDRVAIGPIRRDLIPLYHAWVSNLETTQYLEINGAVITLDEEISWFEQRIRDPSIRTLTMYELPSHRPIGVCELHKIDYRNHNASLGIMIGEPDSRGKGLGTEAVELVLDYGFNALGLHNISLRTYEFNLAGLSTYHKAGFREIGRRRECRFHAGRYWDEIHMDILAPEFTKSRLASRLATRTRSDERTVPEQHP